MIKRFNGTGQRIWQNHPTHLEILRLGSQCTHHIFGPTRLFNHSHHRAEDTNMQESRRLFSRQEPKNLG